MAPFLWNINFGTTHLGFYKPDPRLPMRFRYIDTISASQNFLFAQDNASFPDVKDRKGRRINVA
ncbi:MAG: hypothetical protein JWQ66_4463 [Mucilaginibacter sp.]|nr:hypothetical protein [Mucilaginibacter sp.]